MNEESFIDKDRLIFPQLGGFYERFAPASYAFMRFATGAVLLPHGVQKLFFGAMANTAKGLATRHIAFSDEFALGAAFIESVAALCLMLGLLTRPAALLIAAEMASIVFYFNWANGYFWTNRGVEFALLWMLLAIAIFFRGGGRYSLDRRIGKEL
jgi:putative oxidoreductase